LTLGKCDKSFAYSSRSSTGASRDEQDMSQSRSAPHVESDAGMPRADEREIDASKLEDSGQEGGHADESDEAGTDAPAMRAGGEDRARQSTADEKVDTNEEVERHRKLHRELLLDLQRLDAGNKEQNDAVAKLLDSTESDADRTEIQERGLEGSIFSPSILSPHNLSPRPQEEEVSKIVLEAVKVVHIALTDVCPGTRQTQGVPTINRVAADDCQRGGAAETDVTERRYAGAHV
jgi:hypothetical protein